MNDKLKICIVCERYDKETEKCKECSCYMPLKTAIPFTKCPLNKW